MIFRLPKYCVKIKTKAMQASSPSCMPNGSINIINIIVTTQFITERASPHILFFRSPIAPMIRITPKIAPINKITMFRYLTGDPIVKHDLTVDDLIQRLSVHKSQQDRGQAVLSEGTRRNIFQSTRSQLRP